MIGLIQAISMRFSRLISPSSIAIRFVTVDELVNVTDHNEKYELYENLIFCPNSEFKVGDTMEIAREGLEPNLRGILLEINESAEMWPYRVGQQDGVSVWFGYKELTKIHSIISAQRSGKAKEVLKKQIAEARAELEALETALEILEYAS